MLICLKNQVNARKRDVLFALLVGKNLDILLRIGEYVKKLVLGCCWEPVNGYMFSGWYMGE